MGNCIDSFYEEQKNEAVFKERKKEHKRTVSKFKFSRDKTKKLTVKTLMKKHFKVAIECYLADCSDIFRKQVRPPDKVPFIDKVFPSNENSVIFVNKKSHLSKNITHEEIDEIKGLVWRTPDEVFRTDNYVLYYTIDISDINQGQLGNCYFLAALSALAEKASRFDSIFCKRTALNSYYSIKMYIQGKPKEIYVNNEFPCFKSKVFAFSQSGDKEIWVQVLEKAWAKINCSYAMTIAGLPSEALSSLTKGPCFNYIHKKYSSDKIWSILKYADEQHFIICTSAGGSEAETKVGLVAGHAYSLISVQAYSKDPSVKLIKLRNPWGNYEWNGRYSDESPDWTADMKKEFNFNSNTEDGEFWIHLDDFLSFFSYSFICHYRDHYKYMVKKLTQNPSDSFVCAKMEVEHDGTHVYIGLHQKQQRFYTKVEGYVAQMAHLILARYDEQTREYTFVDSDSSNLEKLYVEQTLNVGTYHIFCKTYWPYDTPCRNVLSTYSAKFVKLCGLSDEETNADYLGLTLADYAEKNGKLMKLENNAEIRYCFGDTDTGFYIMSFKNKNEKKGLAISFNVTISEKVRIVTVSNIEAIQLKDYDYKIIVKLAEEQDSILLFEMLDQPWNCKISNINDFETNILEEIHDRTTIVEIKNAFKDIGVEKIEVNDDVKYFKIDLEEGLILAFVNLGSDDYNVRVNFKSLTNLYVDKTTSAKMIIKRKNFNYVKLLCKEEEEEFELDFEVACQSI